MPESLQSRPQLTQSRCYILISEPLGNPNDKKDVLVKLTSETFSDSSLRIASSTALDTFLHGGKTAVVVLSFVLAQALAAK